MIVWRADAGPVMRAFTGRSGGVSQPPYAGLNLGGHVGDDPAAVDTNRQLLAGALGLRADHLVFLDQRHGTDVAVIGAPTAPDDTPMWRTPPAADASVTTDPEVALVVLVADCVPVLLHSADGSVLAVAHAGRAGMVDGVIPATLSVMRDLGATDLQAVLGPSICGRCYEVPQAMADAAADVASAARAVSWTGTPAIDVAAGVAQQLATAGVHVEWVPGCTAEHGDLYSHRRQAPTGRFAGVIARRSEDRG